MAASLQAAGHSLRHATVSGLGFWGLGFRVSGFRVMSLGLTDRGLKFGVLTSDLSSLNNVKFRSHMQSCSSETGRVLGSSLGSSGAILRNLQL